MEPKKNEPLKPMTPYTTEWNAIANHVARNYVEIVPCKTCGYPRHINYTCMQCGDE